VKIPDFLFLWYDGFCDINQCLFFMKNEKSRLGQKINRTFEVLDFLLSTRSSSKIIYAAMSGNYSKREISNTLSDLKRRGYLYQKNKLWVLSQKGIDFHKKSQKRIYKHFYPTQRKGRKKDILVIFDIPEKERSKRDWLRIQLKRFHYIQIQQSVWYGPSPLPQDFLSYLKKDLNLSNHVKFFKVHKMN